MRDGWLWLTFLGSAAATLAASATDPRQVTGASWMESVPDVDRWEVRTTASGSVRPSGTGVVLDTARCVEACRAAVVLHATLPDGAWRASVEVGRDGPLERARLFAVDRRLDRSVAWYTGRNIEAGEGTASVDVPRSLAGRPIELGVVAIGTGGTIHIGRLDVLPTRASPAWIAWALLASGGWTAIGATSAVRIVRSMNGRAPWVLIGIAALLVVGVLLPRPDPTVPVFVQKVFGHGGAFALLAAIGRSAGAPWTAVLVRLTAFAAATELVQLFRTERSASVADVVLDLFGACVGLAAIRLFRGARPSPPASAANPP